MHTSPPVKITNKSHDLPEEEVVALAHGSIDALPTMQQSIANFLCREEG